MRVLTIGLFLGFSAGGGPASVASYQSDLLVSIRAGVVAAPASISAGWTRFRVEEDGAGHILVLFRLSRVVAPAELATLLTTLDTAATTPAPALALGGPEVGDTGTIMVELTPGQYLLGCVRRGPEGHRHAATGEARILVVTGPSAQAGGGAPPTATQDIAMVDFAYQTPEKWRPGAHLLRVENRGKQEHQLRLARLRPGVTVQAWMSAANPNDMGTTIAGVARMGPGAVAYLPVELAAGTYVAYCLVADPVSKRAHVQMGMLRAIRVE